MIVLKCATMENQQPIEECYEYQRYKKFQMRAMNELRKCFTENNRENFVYYNKTHSNNQNNLEYKQ